MAQLNKMQQEAVNSINGQILVVSCPGSGKTTVIIERCKHMIDCGIDPSFMFNVTFTKSAAEEMEKRYAALYGEAGIQFSTIHSFCYKVLRTELGYTQNDIMKESEKWSFVANKLYRKISPGEMEETTKNVVNEISYVKNRELPLALFYPTSCEKALFECIFRDYEEIKRENKKIDFDDMLIICRDLFKSTSEVLEKWKFKCQYITIDEYQDVNSIQAEVFYMLAGKNGNIFVVGDDDQSIYRFRAADSSIMLNFEKQFPSCKKIFMSTNYRSCKDIVNAAGKLISNNTERFQKDFIANRQEEGNIYLMKNKSSTAQAVNICKELTKMLENGIASKDIAVLYRTNAINLPFITEMMKRKIPFYTTEAPKSIHKDFIFEDMMAYYRLSEQIVRRGDIQRILNRPSRYLKAEYFKNCESDINKVLLTCDKISDCNVRDRVKDKVIDLMYDIKSLQGKSPTEFINRLCVFGYYNWLKDYAAFRGKTAEEFYEVFAALQTEASNFQTMKEWFSYIKTYEETLEKIRKSKDKRGICLSTFHASKGLEWKHVFVVSCNQDITPFAKAETLPDLEEERRMFYVAVTRAKDNLYLSYCTGEVNDLIPSQYLEEMGIMPSPSLSLSGDTSRKLNPVTGLG